MFKSHVNQQIADVKHQIIPEIASEISITCKTQNIHQYNVKFDHPRISHPEGVPLIAMY